MTNDEWWMNKSSPASADDICHSAFCIRHFSAELRSRRLPGYFFSFA
jgi:hypothetical protein